MGFSVFFPSTGNVRSLGVLANNAVVRGDVGAMDIQSSGILIDDSDNLTVGGNIVVTGTVDGVDIASHSHEGTAILSSTAGGAGMVLTSTAGGVSSWENAGTPSAHDLGGATHISGAELEFRIAESDGAGGVRWADTVRSLGPSIDNAVVRMDGTTGEVIQGNDYVTVDNNGNLVAPNLQASGIVSSNHIIAQRDIEQWQSANPLRASFVGVGTWWIKNTSPVNTPRFRDGLGDDHNLLTPLGSDLLSTGEVSERIIESDGSGGTRWVPKPSGTGTGDVLSAESTGTTTDGDGVVFDDANGKNVRKSTIITEAAVSANTDKETNATHTGDVGGSTTLTIQPNVVSNSKLEDMPPQTIKGNNTGITANPFDLNMTAVTFMLPEFNAGAKGLVPASGGGTTNFLRADGSFAAPTAVSYTTLASFNADIVGNGDQVGNVFIDSIDPVASAVDGDVWIDTSV